MTHQVAKNCHKMLKPVVFLKVLCINVHCVSTSSMQSFKNYPANKVKICGNGRSGLSVHFAIGNSSYCYVPLSASNGDPRFEFKLDFSLR